MIKQKAVIGRTTDIVLVSEDGLKVPAKVDTGADGSSIWASDLLMGQDGSLSFCLFAKESPHYTGQRHTTKKYKASAVRSAHGTLQVRYKIELTVVIEKRKVRASFTLADRSRNTYPVLIGCRLLNNKFIVDVSKGRRKQAEKVTGDGPFNAELRKDPVGFFEKYHLDNERGDV